MKDQEQHSATAWILKKFPAEQLHLCHDPHSRAEVVQGISIMMSGAWVSGVCGHPVLCLVEREAMEIAKITDILGPCSTAKLTLLNGL